MESVTILIGSITAAMRGKKILEQNGYSVRLQRISHPQEIGGCGYTLHTKGNMEKIETLLKKFGIRVQNGRGVL